MLYLYAVQQNTPCFVFLYKVLFYCLINLKSEKDEEQGTFGYSWQNVTQLHGQSITQLQNDTKILILGLGKSTEV